MAWARLEADERPGEVLEVRVLNTRAQKLRGLLGTGPEAPPVMLTRCSSVHTFGMPYALDLAFVGERGEVLEVCLAVGGGNVESREGASCVIERPAAPGDWLREGDHLWAQAVSADGFLGSRR